MAAYPVLFNKEGRAQMLIGVCPLVDCTHDGLGNMATETRYVGIEYDLW